MGLSSRRKAQTLFRTNGYYLHHSDIIIDVIGINRKYVLYVTNLPRQRWLSGVDWLMRFSPHRVKIRFKNS